MAAGQIIQKKTATCIKCGKTMNTDRFYVHKDGQVDELCKECLTMHIDNWNPDTFLWILERLDAPYVPEEWDALRNKAYAKDPNKVTGMSVLGRYLSKMRLKQYWNPDTKKPYGYADSEMLQSRNRDKREKAAAQLEQYREEIQEKYDNGEISEAQYTTLISAQEEYDHAMSSPVNQDAAAAASGFYNENDYMREDELTDLGADLTQDDKLYLAMKWGRLYKPNEWVLLEKDYNEMMNSFDIHDADTINTLKLICKTNLKLNQAIDCGDVEGYQKLSRVYDSLRKSAKFTAAQNKEQKADFIDSLGEMVAYCEKHGGVIPPHEIKADADIVDTVIRDLKAYTKSLIYEDKALAKQIEDYLKKKEIAEQMKKDRLESKGKKVEVKDEDIVKNLDRIEEEKIQDQEIYNTEVEDTE